MDANTANAIFNRDAEELIAFVTELMQPGVLEDILNPTLDSKFADATLHNQIRDDMLGLIVARHAVQGNTFTSKGREIILYLTPLLLLIWSYANIGQCPLSNMPAEDTMVALAFLCPHQDNPSVKAALE